MSKDIRSFFAAKSSSKDKGKTETPFTKAKTPRPIDISDDDVIPESPDVQIKSKKSRTVKKQRIIKDSSDEEIFEKPSIKQKKTEPKTPIASKNKEKPSLKEVKAVDIFGDGPIKRTELPKKKKHDHKQNLSTEINIHSDEELEKTLLEIDTEAETADNKNSSTVSSVNVDLIKPSKRLDSKSNSDNSKTIKESPKKQSKLQVSGPVKTQIAVISKSSTPPKKKEAEITDDFDSKKGPKKRDFSEFSDIASTSLADSQDERTPKSKKRKTDLSLNESALTDEERHERKRHSSILYQQYKNRGGPKHPGSKEIPNGSPDCLKGCSFLLTGVLDSFEREEISEVITKYGGVIKSGISKKVTHVLAGEEAGPAKLAKAEDLGIQILNEDQFLDLITKSSNKLNHVNNHDKKVEEASKLSNNKNKSNSGKFQNDSSDIKIKKIKVEKSPANDKTHRKLNGNVNKKMENSSQSSDSDSRIEKVKSEKSSKVESVSTKKGSDTKMVTMLKDCKSEDKPSSSSSENKQDFNNGPKSNNITSPNALMWVDKYKPQSIKQIIGQHGDASNAKKLTNWLMRWYISRKEKLQKPSPWAKNDDGGYFKAALCSGPPGVGKTTTVSLVCAELGFDVVEFNASDTRNKTLIKEQITELLTTTSLSGYAKGDTSKKAITKKHVLLMDEVDGMAGNEDRGGLQELISLIKIAAVPIICTCNDRNSTKMRTLVNYCYDLRFSRPRVDQIKSAMMSVCFKEGIKIQPDTLSQLIVASNQDVRQTLNLLSMWSVNTKDGEQVKKDSTYTKKDIKLGPWEAVRKVFSAEEHKSMSIYDKSDLFFYDYSIAPLFVQENYLQVVPHCPKNELLERVSMAADSIALGDLVESKIRRNGAWALLPTQAMYSSVIPGHSMSGHVAGQIQFPSWLGKNSRNSKMQRLAQEVHAHARLSASGSKSSIFLDYCKYLRDAIVQPLIKEKMEGIPTALEVLQSYNLLREDLESLTELAQWPGQRDPMVLVDSKVKAAMTRTYNNEAVALPYASGSVRRGRGRVAGADSEGLELEETQAEDEGTEPDDSDPENDAMIKKKKKAVQKNKDSESQSSGSEKPKKGKGRGKKGS